MHVFSIAACPHYLPRATMLLRPMQPLGRAVCVCVRAHGTKYGCGCVRVGVLVKLGGVGEDLRQPRS